MNLKLLESEKNRKSPNPNDIRDYEERDARVIQQIDSVKHLSPDNLTVYEKADKNKVLGKIVRCKYSILNPFTNRTVEETYDFALSPDGSKVYKATKVKNE